MVRTDIFIENNPSAHDEQDGYEYINYALQLSHYELLFGFWFGCCG